MARKEVSLGWKELILEHSLADSQEICVVVSVRYYITPHRDRRILQAVSRPHRLLTKVIVGGVFPLVVR